MLAALHSVGIGNRVSVSFAPGSSVSPLGRHFNDAEVGLIGGNTEHRSLTNMSFNEIFRGLGLML